MHFVSGDVTSPVGSKPIIVHCVDDSGEWGSGGLFTALSNKTVEPELYYELAGDMEDLHNGDLHLISCEKTSGYDEYHVGLLVAQDRSLKVRQSLLATCLQKLSHKCKSLSGMSVHLPRIGYSTPGFDWYSTERQLRKYLSNKKIHTYIYYYKRPSAKRQSSPSASSSKRARSQSPMPSTSKDVLRSASASTSKDARPVVEEGSVLEDVFTDVTFVIESSVDTAEARRVKRYIIAFNGQVQPYETETTKYIVSSTATGGSTAGAPPYTVQPEFVFESVRLGRVID